MSAPELKWPNWIGVVVEDLEAQRRFYRDVMGLRELGAGDGWVHFDMGFPNILELVQRTNEPEYDRVRYQAGFAVDDIHSAREHLIARGVEAITEIDGGPESQGYWAYFRDPEGNVFEISQRLGNAWESHADA
jgi:catechol 2,3-dioxygenase-like lactoylglutathione lyase family enzyme